MKGAKILSKLFSTSKKRVLKAYLVILLAGAYLIFFRNIFLLTHSMFQTGNICTDEVSLVPVKQCFVLVSNSNITTSLLQGIQVGVVSCIEVVVQE